MPASPPLRLAVITALKEELAAVRKGVGEAQPGILALRGGVGPASATAAVASLASKMPAVVASCGFCGGLDSAPRAGDVILPERIADGSGGQPPIACDAECLRAWRAALENAGLRVHGGTLASVGAAVASCEAKRELGQRSGAIAVDMESFAIARAAAAAGARVMALRAISDASEDALPPEVGEFLDAHGNVRATAIAKFMLKSPRGNMRALLALKARSEAAAASLQKAWRALAPLV